jgi:hypothetical protein
MCSAVANPSFHKRTFWAAAIAGALFIAFLARQLLCLSAAGGPTGWWGQRRTGVFMRAGVERGLDRTCLKEAGLEGASISADGTCMATEGSSSGGWPIDVVRGASRAPTSLKQTASSMGCWRYRPEASQRGGNTAGTLCVAGAFKFWCTASLQED